MSLFAVEHDVAGVSMLVCKAGSAIMGSTLTGFTALTVDTDSTRAIEA